jgi:hypothetical protein
MASTRNKNSSGDYMMEEMQYFNRRSYITNNIYGAPVTSYFPSDGLLPTRMAPTELSNNPSDIESYLFGINSTNLVNPVAPVTPDIKTLKSLSVIDRTPLILPKPFAPLTGQRPAMS